MLDDLNRALEEPDGAYVRRFVDDNMDTRIIPVINGHEKSSPEAGQPNGESGENPPDKRRGWVLVTISAIAAAAVCWYFLWLSAVYLNKILL